METQTVKLADIKNTEPQREHGDLSKLKDSITDVGLINPITIDQNLNLMAGRRRFHALTELGWEDVLVRVIPINGDSLMAFRIAIDENLKRKQLTDPEVAIAIKEYDELKRKIEGGARRGERTDLTSAQCAQVPWTQERTANDLGISPPAVRKAIRIAEAIEEYPGLAAESSGQAILSEIKRIDERKAIKEVTASETDLFKIIDGDFLTEYPKMPAESIDAIVTDPPWTLEACDIYGDLAEAAAHLLKPGGSLLAMVGLIALAKVIPLMTPHIRYHWTIAYLTPHSTLYARGHNVHCGWKPILWFVKGRYSKAFFADPVISEEREKEYYNWQQSISGMSALIKPVSWPGDTILDPFAGSGSTGVAALRLGRKFIGIEIDPERAKLSENRMYKELENSDES